MSGNGQQNEELREVVSLHEWHPEPVQRQACSQAANAENDRILREHHACVSVLAAGRCVVISFNR